jgi:hypothetical protein
VRQPALAEHADGLEDGHEPGLVVPAQHAGVIGVDDVSLDHGADLAGRGHGVHVTREEKRRRGRVRPREAREDIAGVAAHLLAGVVHLHAGAHVLENGFEPPPDLALLSGQAGDGRQLEELFRQALPVDHRGSLSLRCLVIQPRLRSTASSRWRGSVNR